MTIVARTFATFAEGFALSYADEVSGETYFATFATAEPDPRRAAIWDKIALIENRMEAALRPLAKALGVIPANLAALRQSGRDEALADPIQCWEAAMEEMAREYPAYLDEFAGLKVIAPQEAFDVMDLLYAHEVAMIDFAKLEIAGRHDSGAPLDAFLARLQNGPDGRIQ
jgi:hypothetical protein